jgi:hypothetical protein
MNSHDALMKALEAWSTCDQLNDPESAVDALMDAYRAHRKAEGIWLEKPKSKTHMDLCAHCGQWVGGPVQCCNEYDGSTLPQEVDGR